MSAYVHDSSFFSRRAAVFVAIILVHVLLIWGISTGLARRLIEVVAPPLQTDIVEEVQKRDEAPPPPPPQMERPPVEVPPPDVTIDIPVESTSTAIQDVTDRHVVAAPPPPPPPKAVVRVSAKPGKNFPNTEDYYPPSSKRLGEEGTVTIRACVGPNGKLVEDPTIAKGSGNVRLDDGALKLAKAGSGRYQPGTEDGKPANSCTMFNVRFEMKN